MHISVGSMLARSTLQGMQEPQVVGRVMKYSSHIFFCAVPNLINNFFNAESGGKEANDKNHEEDYIAIIADGHFAGCSIFNLLQNNSGGRNVHSVKCKKKFDGFFC